MGLIAQMCFPSQNESKPRYVSVACFLSYVVRCGVREHSIGAGGWFVLCCLALIGCGQTSGATAVNQASPTGNPGATATRAAELAQLATLVPAATAATQATPVPVTPTVIDAAATPADATVLAPTPTALSAPSSAVANTAEPTNRPLTVDAPTATATAAPEPSASTDTPSPPAVPTTRVVTILVDGTGDSVNIRSAPDMSGRVLAQARPGAEVQLHDTSDAVDGNGSHWLKVEVDHGGIGYIRRDLVSTPHAASDVISTPTFVPTRVPSSQARAPHSDPSLTNTPFRTYPDLYYWAVPQSQGGYLLTYCAAFRSVFKTVGAYDCYTEWFASMDAVAATIHKSQTLFHTIYLEVPPNPPRVYLKDVYTAVAYSDSGIYLAQAVNDKDAIDRARANAKASCGASCDVPVFYFYQS